MGARWRIINLLKSKKITIAPVETGLKKSSTCNFIPQPPERNAQTQFAKACVCGGAPTDNADHPLATWMRVGNHLTLDDLVCAQHGLSEVTHMHVRPNPHCQQRYNGAATWNPHAAPAKSIGSCGNSPRTGQAKDQPRARPSANQGPGQNQGPCQKP